MNTELTAEIVVTQRMLSKSIIDANRSVVAMLKASLLMIREAGGSYLLEYDNLQHGKEFKVTKPILYHSDAQVLETVISFYCRPRGDKLLWIKGLPHLAEVGDKVILSIHRKPDTEGTIWMSIVKAEKT